jgi:hypothetical protein
MSGDRRAYDHRLRDLVCRTGDLELGVQMGVQRSTAASWIRRGARPVVTAEVVDQDAQELNLVVPPANLIPSSSRSPWRTA